MTTWDYNRLLAACGGMLQLGPTFVPRAYKDLNRLNQRRSIGTVHPVPERWIGSSIRANNAPPLPNDVGLSVVRDRVPGCPGVSLRDLVAAMPVATLGARLAERFGAFTVLVKILDPGEAIPLHLHPNDALVEKQPRRFPGQRFGKDEAYYFLDAPKGPMPYTHAGLRAGVTRAELVAAIRHGPEHALELMPSFYPRTGEGFFVPAGVPHRPGTALTLEIQQLSDVSQRLEPATIKRGADLIETELSWRVGLLRGFAILPASRRVRGGDLAAIFPAKLCRKFFGDRIRVNSTLSYAIDSPLAILVWQGRGRINDRPVRAGDEFFITFDAARRGLTIENPSDDPLELFAFGPVG